MRWNRYLLVLVGLLFASVACFSSGASIGLDDSEVVVPAEGGASDEDLGGIEEPVQEQPQGGEQAPAQPTLPEDERPIREAPGGGEANTGPVAAALQPFADGFSSPVAMATDSAGSIYIADQVGVVYKLSADGSIRETFLDVRSRLVNLNEGYDERGLLGIVFHPADDSRFFVYYSAPRRQGGSGDHTSHISEFAVVNGTANPNSERIVMQVDQPFANHDGGQLAFGSDQYLYIGLGDGGSAGDPRGNGQNRGTLLGSILRIDVDSGDPYGVPSDNPFADGETAAPETWAYGFRNPFRFSFDSATGNLWAGDVGQSLIEEVDIVTAGNNYGWNTKEGTQCYEANSCADTDDYGQPLVDPVMQYDHGVGISIIGGYVYRGSAIPALAGQYVFGDWTGVLFVGADSGNGWNWNYPNTNGDPGGNIGVNLLAFGQDNSGELYVLTNSGRGPSGSGGAVWKIVGG